MKEFGNRKTWVVLSLALALSLYLGSPSYGLNGSSSGGGEPCKMIDGTLATFEVTNSKGKKVKLRYCEVGGNQCQIHVCKGTAKKKGE